MHCCVPIRVVMRDGEILDIDPEEGLVGYVAVPFSKWYDDISYA